MRVEDHTTDNLLQNWQVQAEAQEIFRAAVLELDEAGYAITGLNHDSVLLEMEEDEDPAPAAEIMSDAAEELLGIRLRVDAEVMKPKPSPFWTMVITRLTS